LAKNKEVPDHKFGVPPVRWYANYRTLTLDRCLFPFIIFLFSVLVGSQFPEKNISKKDKDDKYGKCNLNYA
jgi:hypothetical protein